MSRSKNHSGQSVFSQRFFAGSKPRAQNRHQKQKGAKMLNRKPEALAFTPLPGTIQFQVSSARHNA
jgi:hypothetical protein